MRTELLWNLISILDPSQHMDCMFCKIVIPFGIFVIDSLKSRAWELSKEDDDNIMVNNVMTAWTNLMVRVHQCALYTIRMEKEIRISELGEEYHILPHLFAQDIQ